MNADSSDPQQRDECEMRLWFQSVDSEAEMPIVSMEKTEHGTSILWRVPFKNDFTLGEKGFTFHAGDTYDMDATLRKSGVSWLIDNF